MEEYVAVAFAVQRELRTAGVRRHAKSPGWCGFPCVRVGLVIVPIGGVRPHALAGGLVGFGVVCMLVAPRLEDWRALTFLGLALAIPSVVWLVADRWFSWPTGALWWLLVGAAVALGVWGIALFPPR